MHDVLRTKKILTSMKNKQTKEKTDQMTPWMKAPAVKRTVCRRAFLVARNTCLQSVNSVKKRNAASCSRFKDLLPLYEGSHWLLKGLCDALIWFRMVHEDNSSWVLPRKFSSESDYKGNCRRNVSEFHIYSSNLLTSSWIIPAQSFHRTLITTFVNHGSCAK